MSGWRQKDFSKRLRALIDERGVTPNAFAVEAKISPTRVASWLKGARPSDRYLEKLSEALGVSVEWLLVGDTAAVAAGGGTVPPPKKQEARAQSRAKVRG